MTDAPKVVGLDRKPVEVVEDGTVNHAVVNLLETLLAEARAGRIAGAAVAYCVDHEHDTEFKSEWAGPKITMLGTLSRAVYAMNRMLDQTDHGQIGEPPHDGRS